MITLRTSAIYSLNYSAWKHNRRIYAFIFYGGPNSNKVHALNLGARELGTIGRAKIANIIARLSKVPAAKQWDGATLYRIFKTYLPKEVSQCYRTYFRAYISQVSLINYGFNSPDSFTDLDLSQNNKQLFEAAGRDLFIKLLNSFSGRGVKKKAVEDSMAVAGIAAKTPPAVIETVLTPVAKQIKPVPVADNSEIKGYY